MPLLTGTTAPAVADLAARLSADYSAGRTSRLSLGAKDAAFGWVEGLPSTIAPHVTKGTVQGMSFTAMMLADSGTPADTVAPAAPKPAAVTFTTVSVPLVKKAGKGTWTLEQNLSTEGLAFAVSKILTRQVLLAFDTDVAAALNAATTPVTTDTTWPDAILGAYGRVAAEGGNPNLLIINPADYAKVLQPADGYGVDPTNGRGMLFGLEIVLSAAVAAGNAYVLDASAVLVAEQEAGPIALLDPYSLSGSNQISLVLDYLAGVLVTAPEGVAAVTPTIALAARGETHRR